MIINLISDTITKPTPEMLKAMMRAEVGDDVFGDDPTVKSILEATTGIFAALMDQAMKPLKPYLAKLSGTIPPIPGIDAFNNNIGDLEAEYKKIDKAYKRANQSLIKLTDYETSLKTSFNSIVAKTGCGQEI